MIDRKQLLIDLKPLVRDLETDLRARCDEIPRINDGLTKEYEQARSANRAGITFEEWRADLITQVAVAWVLSSVFVRFLEDNALISPPRISGSLHSAGDAQGLLRARDERDLFFRSHPTQTDRDYLLSMFEDLARLPGTRDIFGPHNPVSAYSDWLSGDAAQKLIEFFQKIDADGTGEINHDFTDDHWDTRFLGDLYQDLSEAARKKYALLQTPEFVEEFILERTLEPAIREFGLKDFKMIDPACGSGHFLLGSFARILGHWRKAEPGTTDRELVNRVLAAVHGVDLNPYAVAIARFRLLLAAMKECLVTRLKDAPNFQFNLACGDSLLHGSFNGQQQVMGFHGLAHHYQSEDIDELRRILKPRQYHAVVANPPYITVKDRILSQAYRERYGDVCYRKYSLCVPFMQRLFSLGCTSGYVGQITANSFMRREFGKKLVENYLPTVDLTCIIDTSGAYIPGHGTPTVILFGRSRRPISNGIRCAMGKQSEPHTPAIPEEGVVWSAIVSNIDLVGYQDQFITITDIDRLRLARHPWNIGGGGVAELKMLLDNASDVRLGNLAYSIGFSSILAEDDAFTYPKGNSHVRRLGPELRRLYVIGEDVRDWGWRAYSEVVFPYDEDIRLRDHPIIRQFLWAWRTTLWGRPDFGGTTYKAKGRTYYEYHQIPSERNRTPLAITFANVSTYNNFALVHGRALFNAHAPIISLPQSLGISERQSILAILNSSVCCFWLRQSCHNKGRPGAEIAGADELWEQRYEFDNTKLGQFPIPNERPTYLGEKIDNLAQALALTSSAVLEKSDKAVDRVSKSDQKIWQETLQQLISFQEELDWECYRIYGLLNDSIRCENPPLIKLGQRAFEIVLARRVAAGEEETVWFQRHGSTPITSVPAKWPEDYKRVVQKRIEIIESDPNIGLIERSEYKRRWNIEPWEMQQEKVLRNWLLDRLESYFDLDGRMNHHKTVTARGNLHEPKLTSVAQVADLARQDKDFMQVAELFTDRRDFDVANLVGELVVAESVPCLPVLRYKPTGLDKRAAWERTWELQRLEDAVDALFDVERLKHIEPNKSEEILRPLVAALRINDQVKPKVMNDAVMAASYVAEAIKQNLNLATELILRPVTDAAKRAKKLAVGDIPVPPKYTSADFLSSNFWRLRGKLDVPKERWVSFPQCESQDGTMAFAWAGYDHLQLARAIAERYEQAKELEGRKLVPLLASIGQIIPWLKQWHNELDQVFGTRMGDYFEDYLAEEAKALGMTVAEVMAWKPPEQPCRRGGRRRSTQAVES